MIDVSYLQNVYEKDGQRRLQQSHVTNIGTYETFEAFAEGLLTEAVMPKVPTNKLDAHGWTPTLFNPSGEEDELNERNDRFGNPTRVWCIRRKEYAAEHLTLFVADLDNHHDDRPMVTIDAVEQTLQSLSLPYLLYTSFSHKPERNKVRIVVPVTRPLTPAEAFTVFTVMNYVFQYQLDGSIYDAGDFLYGPPINADIRLSTTGQPLDVDHYLGEAEALPEEAKTIVQRNSSDHDRRPATPEEIANFNERFASNEVNETVGLNNPKYFRREWLDLADTLYCGGSHWQTMIGLLTKAWLKSNCELSRADLETIQQELDYHWGGYLGNQYSRSELNRAVKDVMKQVGSLRITEPPTDRAIQAAFERMRKNKNRKRNK